MRESRGSKQQNLLNQLLVKDILLNSVRPEPQGRSPMEQLNLLYKEGDTQDLNQLREILGKALTYPSTDIAKLHMKANRLGDLDLKESQDKTQALNYKQISQNAKFCPCCGFIRQQNKLGIMTDIEDINHMGVSTFLYFTTIKNIIIMLLIMFCVFSLYAIISNVIASDGYKKTVSGTQIDPKLLSYEGFLTISLGSKQLHQTDGDKISYTVQCWLGVAMLAIWAILFAVIKQRQRVISIDVDRDSKTASDFTVLIKNFPSTMTKQQLQIQLQQYRKSIADTINIHEASRPIVINKINKATPFYLNQQNFQSQQLTHLNQKYDQYRQTFIRWIKQRQKNNRFSEPVQVRKKKLEQFNKIKTDRMNLYKVLGQNVKKQMERTEYDQVVPTFVTFQSSYNKQFLDFIHEDHRSIFSYLPCADRTRYFHFKNNISNQNRAKIRMAPQPEDIIWTNLGQPTSTYIKKRFITFAATTILLSASFGAIYGLSKVQFDYAKTHTDTSNQYISILISLCISIINIIIQQILRLLTKIQRPYTNTDYQISLGLKAVLALLVNSILIPILVNRFFKENLYGVNGLAYDVFYLGITNSFLSPLLKIFDLYYFYTRIWWRYKRGPTRKLALNQNQLNAIAEYMQFEIGYEYIYVVNLFLFTCFFSPLQPIIVVFALVGLFLMYWAQKYSLFNRCRRPFPSNSSLNTAMYQLIYLGAAFYTIGSFCWSNFFKQSFIGIAPNVTAAAISGVIFLLPYKTLIKSCFNTEIQADQSFQQDRIFMPSQYDRLNPTTSSQAITDYKNYLVQYRQKLQQKQKTNPQQVRYVQNQFLKQFGLGCRKHQPIIPGLHNLIGGNNGTGYNQQEIVLQELFGGGKNIYNPTVIGNAVVSDNNPLGIIAQNWLTQGQTVTYNTNNNNNNNMNNNLSPNCILKMTDSVLKFDQGETVTYNKPAMNNQNQNQDEGLNVIYQGVVNLADHKPNQPGKRGPIKQMPLGLSINLLGSLVNNTETDTDQYGYPPANINNQYPSIKPNRGAVLPPIPNPNPNPNLNNYNNNNNTNLFNYIADADRYKTNPNSNPAFDPYSLNLHMNSNNQINQNQFGNNNNHNNNNNAPYNPYGGNPYGYGQGQF